MIKTFETICIDSRRRTSFNERINDDFEKPERPEVNLTLIE